MLIAVIVVLAIIIVAGAAFLFLRMKPPPESKGIGLLPPNTTAPLYLDEVEIIGQPELVGKQVNFYSGDKLISIKSYSSLSSTKIQKDSAQSYVGEIPIGVVSQIRGFAGIPITRIEADFGTRRGIIRGKLNNRFVFATEISADTPIVIGV